MYIPAPARPASRSLVPMRPVSPAQLGFVQESSASPLALAVAFDHETLTARVALSGHLATSDAVADAVESVLRQGHACERGDVPGIGAHAFVLRLPATPDERSIRRALAVIARVAALCAAAGLDPSETAAAITTLAVDAAPSDVLAIDHARAALDPSLEGAHLLLDPALVLVGQCARACPPLAQALMESVVWRLRRALLEAGAQAVSSGEQDIAAPVDLDHFQEMAGWCHALQLMAPKTRQACEDVLQAFGRGLPNLQRAIALERKLLQVEAVTAPMVQALRGFCAQPPEPGALHEWLKDMIDLAFQVPSVWRFPAVDGVRAVLVDHAAGLGFALHVAEAGGPRISAQALASLPPALLAADSVLAWLGGPLPWCASWLRQVLQSPISVAHRPALHAILPTCLALLPDAAGESAPVEARILRRVPRAARRLRVLLPLGVCDADTAQLLVTVRLFACLHRRADADDLRQLARLVRDGIVQQFAAATRKDTLDCLLRVARAGERPLRVDGQWRLDGLSPALCTVFTSLGYLPGDAVYGMPLLRAGARFLASEPADDAPVHAPGTPAAMALASNPALWLGVVLGTASEPEFVEAFFLAARALIADRRTLDAALAAICAAVFKFPSSSRRTMMRTTCCALLAFMDPEGADPSAVDRMSDALGGAVTDSFGGCLRRHPDRGLGESHIVPPGIASALLQCGVGSPRHLLAWLARPDDDAVLDRAMRRIVRIVTEGRLTAPGEFDAQRLEVQIDPIIYSGLLEDAQWLAGQAPVHLVRLLFALVARASRVELLELADRLSQLGVLHPDALVCLRLTTLPDDAFLQRLKTDLALIVQRLTSGHAAAHRYVLVGMLGRRFARAVSHWSATQLEAEWPLPTVLTSLPQLCVAFFGGVPVKLRVQLINACFLSPDRRAQDCAAALLVEPLIAPWLQQQLFNAIDVASGRGTSLDSLCEQVEAFLQRYSRQSTTHFLQGHGENHLQVARRCEEIVLGLRAQRPSRSPVARTLSRMADALRRQ